LLGTLYTSYDIISQISNTVTSARLESSWIYSTAKEITLKCRTFFDKHGRVSIGF
jgi:hypothetical protein